MRIDRTGATRIVFILKRVVVKIPNFTFCWQNFIRGLLANIVERETWRYNTGTFDKGKSHLLCPVLWVSWGGWLLIMKKVDKVLTYDEGWEADLSEHVKMFPGDDTGPNYGILNKCIVKIDYGNINGS